MRAAAAAISAKVDGQSLFAHGIIDAADPVEHTVLRRPARSPDGVPVFAREALACSDLRLEAARISRSRFVVLSVARAQASSAALISWILRSSTVS